MKITTRKGDLVLLKMIPYGEAFIYQGQGFISVEPCTDIKRLTKDDRVFCVGANGLAYLPSDISVIPAIYNEIIIQPKVN